VASLGSIPDPYRHAALGHGCTRSGTGFGSGRMICADIGNKEKTTEPDAYSNKQNYLF
jgi:hypothetical protein